MATGAYRTPRGWRRHDAAAPAGILPSRAVAQAALLRMLSRARRHGRPLLLLSLTAVAPAEFWTELATDCRIADLAWQESSGQVLALLEDTAAPAAVAERLRERARARGIALGLGWAQFPRQGLTLEALLERVRGEGQWVTP